MSLPDPGTAQLQKSFDHDPHTDGSQNEHPPPKDQKHFVIDNVKRQHTNGIDVGWSPSPSKPEIEF